MAGHLLASTSTFDVLGVGCASVDDLVVVDAFPAPNMKMAVRERARFFGGLTSTALVAAARLGSRCAFAGVLGEDDLSNAVIAQLQLEQVDVSLVRRRPDARPVHSVVVVGEEQGTRNIFYSLDGVFAAEPGWPPSEAIRSTAVLFVDHVGIDGAIAAATVARDAGIPIVADLEGDMTAAVRELVDLVDHLVLSHDFARELTGLDDPKAIVERLWSDEREAVVVTVGAEGSWYRIAGDASVPQHQPAFRVPVVDTTGCGDVFHGAYASTLARGLEPAVRLRFATAAAALKATCQGAQSGSPTRAAVETFLEANPT